MGTFRYDVFLSHSSADKDRLIEPLYRALVGRQLEVFFDRYDVGDGDPDEVCPAALADSRVTVFVTAPTSRGHYDKSELIRAIEQRRQSAGTQDLLVVLVEGAEPPFGGEHHLPTVHAAGPHEMPEVAEQISRWLGGEDDALPPPPPAWVDHQRALPLLPLLLLGGGSLVQTADAEAATPLVSKVEVRTAIARWREDSDGPFHTTGNAWWWRDSSAAFRWLGPRVSPDLADAFERVAVTVLSERDPRLDLPPEEREIAPLRGIGLLASEHLRRGIAQTVRMLGAHPDRRVLPGRVRAQDRAARVVRQILLPDDAGIWRSLGDLLPALAEAAPDVFLQAVDDGVDTLRELLAPPGNPLSAYAGDPLRQALELIAWDPHRAPHAAMLMASLLDGTTEPGNRMGMGSALQALVHPQFPDDADASGLADVLTALLRVDRGRVLQLIVWAMDTRPGVLPHLGTPHFRVVPDLADVSSQVVRARYARLVETWEALAGDDAEAWAAMVPQLRPAMGEVASRWLAHLEEMDPASAERTTRSLLWMRISDLLAEHRKFPDADWTFDEPDLVALDRMVARWAPPTALERAVSLFRDHVPIGERDPSQYFSALTQLRNDALAEVMAEGGLDGVLALSRQVAAPGQVGRALAAWTLTRDDGAFVRSDVVARINMDESGERGLVGGMTMAVSMHDGVLSELVTLDRFGSDAALRRHLLALLPCHPRVWSQLASPNLLDEFWDVVNANVFSDVERSDVAVAIRALLERGRGIEAAHVLWSASRKDAPFDAEMLLNVLEAVPNSRAPQGTAFGAGHTIRDLLRQAEERHDVDRHRIALVQLTLFDLYRHGQDHAPESLRSALQGDPGLYVTLVSYAFVSDEVLAIDRDDRPTLGDAETARARRAHLILDEVIPFAHQAADGELTSWVAEARATAEERGFVEATEACLGRVVAGATTSETWPSEEAVEIIETSPGQRFREGFLQQVLNSFGVFTSAVGEGGRVQNERADWYRKIAKRLGGAPRTARLMRTIADDLELQGHQWGQHDEELVLRFSGP